MIFEVNLEPYIIQLQSWIQMVFYFDWSHIFQFCYKGRVERGRDSRSGSDASGCSDGVGLENCVTVELEEYGLLGVERADVQRQRNAPLQ